MPTFFFFFERSKVKVKGQRSRLKVKGQRSRSKVTGNVEFTRDFRKLEKNTKFGSKIDFKSKKMPIFF